jgi:indole-3-glycerol phosphate synthase
MSLLARILAQKQLEIARGVAPGAEGVAVVSPRTPLDVASVLLRSGERPRLDPDLTRERPARGALRLIGEVKFKSPSAGALSRALDAAERAVLYVREGARMVSVLCDTEFFGGGFGDLARVRRALDLRGLSVPVLAKEFIVDPIQLEWAAHYGADCALLIARILEPSLLGSLVARARALGLEPFVEVVTERERDLALEVDARVIGVNARDLDTLVMDADRVAKILAGIPEGRAAVHLSGIGTASSVAQVAKGRADAALLGEALMRVADPGPVLRDFVSAAGGLPEAIPGDSVRCAPGAARSGA